MSWPSQLVLVRHAESLGNTLDRDQRAALDMASYAYPLSERGKAQAEYTGKYLREHFGSFDAYYTSYYRRTKETMNLLYPEAKVYEDARLAEAQRGIYHTHSLSEIELLYPNEILRKEREGLYHYRPWGGENWLDIEMRVHSFLGTLARDYAGQKVLIVCHGHWLLLFERLVLRFSIEEAVRRYREDEIAANASVTVYTGNERLHRESYSIPWSPNLSKRDSDTSDHMAGEPKTN